MAATGGRRMDEARWTWDLEPNHSIDVTVGDAGLSYYGEDWNSLSGGGYFAGFQSFADFRRDGPLKGMPPEVAAEVRRVVDVAEGGGLDFVIVVDGETPEEIHATLDGRTLMLRETATLFAGPLPDGEHRVEGVLLYPGDDARGRRRARVFEERFCVDAAGSLRITETRPRWAD
ncbi:MAG: hypothetical protein KC486_17345 [Myxococcales bacterium]|nr:hypothetical protein [Myxococcales bacterium]